MGINRESNYDVCLKFKDTPTGKFMFLTDLLEDRESYKARAESAEAKLKELKRVLKSGIEDWQSILDDPLEEDKSLTINDAIENEKILLAILLNEKEGE